MFPCSFQLDRDAKTVILPQHRVRDAVVTTTNTVKIHNGVVEGIDPGIPSPGMMLLPQLEARTLSLLSRALDIG